MPSPPSRGSVSVGSVKRSGDIAARSWEKGVAKLLWEAVDVNEMQFVDKVADVLVIIPSNTENHRGVPYAVERQSDGFRFVQQRERQNPLDNHRELWRFRRCKISTG